MNGLEVMGFCLLIGLHAGAIVWAAWTVEENARIARDNHSGEKSKSLISNPGRLP